MRSILSYLLPGLIAAQAVSAAGLGGTALTPFRMPLAENRIYIDLDLDGDPDLLKGTITGDIPILWVDDDDDMLSGDPEGDWDNDCLLVDRNKDGKFAAERDLSIDHGDFDGDGRADLQVLVENADPNISNRFDWNSNLIYQIAQDGDDRFSYVDWNLLKHRGWDHIKNDRFFEDYTGQMLFSKMSVSSFYIGDLRYSWENPFLFFDPDQDGLAEMAIRMVDDPIFANPDATGATTSFDGIMNYAAVTFDLDNDNGEAENFDFDMSLVFRDGRGFDYRDQVHLLDFPEGPNLADLQVPGLQFRDTRWRELRELIYPDHDSAMDLIFQRGQWGQCWLVFDEDDDCNRWERVEFYEPKDVFIIGRGNGGIDNNSQADASGDRGEWDTDNSGRGRLYVGRFDGRLHLYGAEWGAWRIDQHALSYQGYGGLYDIPSFYTSGRLQREPTTFATVRYSDNNGNGFFDRLQYDLDGNKQYERTVDLLALGIDDRCPLIETADLSLVDLQDLYQQVALDLYQRGEDAAEAARRLGLNPEWYAIYGAPVTLQDHYHGGFWRNFYLYHDLLELARQRGDSALQATIEKANASGDWNLLLQDVADRRVTHLLGANTTYVDGAYTSPWLGSLSGRWPWLEHARLGPLFLKSAPGGGLLYFDPHLGWIWTAPALYPWMYRYAPAGWIVFLPESAGPERWFARWNGSTWEYFPAGSAP